MKATDCWPLGAWIETPPVRVRDPETGVDCDVLTGGVGNNTRYHPHPAFSPDGKRIVFCRRDAAGRNDVCLLCPSPTGRDE